jgi:hypothetical protein
MISGSGKNPGSTMKKYTFENLASLRLLIGFLGEQHQFNWWHSSFVSTSSNAFLTPIYPRTSLIAKYQGVKESAAKVHDEHIGIGKTYHLFRLPEFIEQRILQILGDSGFASQLQESLTTIDEALAALLRFGKSERAIDEGPVLLGKIEDIEQPELISNIAAIYYSAFQNNIKSYPYLRESE